MSKPQEMDGGGEGAGGEGAGGGGASGDGVSGDGVGRSGVSGRSGAEMVSVFDDEMTVSGAVELMGEMLENPEAFGMVPESSHRDLRRRVEELEEQNEELVESLRRAYSIMDEAESMSQFTIDESVYDPTEEFR